MVICLWCHLQLPQQASEESQEQAEFTERVHSRSRCTARVPSSRIICNAPQCGIKKAQDLLCLLPPVQVVLSRENSLNGTDRFGARGEQHQARDGHQRVPVLSEVCA